MAVSLSSSLTRSSSSKRLVFMPSIKMLILFVSEAIQLLSDEELALFEPESFVIVQVDLAWLASSFYECL